MLSPCRRAAAATGPGERSRVELHDLNDARACEDARTRRFILFDIGIEELEDRAVVLVAGRPDYLGWALVEHDAVLVPVHGA